MGAKYVIFIAVLNCFYFISQAVTQVGIIIKQEDESLVTIVENVLREQQATDSLSDLNIHLLVEIVDKDDTVSYQRAFCRLIAKGIIALVSPTSEPHSSILTGYANEYQIPFITTELPEITSGLSGPFAISIRPSTTRAMLSLFLHHGWSDVVYLYDHEYGSEKLQLIFLLGHRVLKLSLDFIFKVDTAELANWYLQLLDRSYGNKVFHVILDMDPKLARDIIWRHVNDVNVRKKNFHFLLSQPTMNDFWTLERTAFGPVNVTTFNIQSQHEEAKSTIKAWMKDKHDFNILSLYYYDAALVLHQTIKLLFTHDPRLQSGLSTTTRDCLKDQPLPIIDSSVLQRTIEQINIRYGATGRIQFENGLRSKFELNITEITSRGYYNTGTWKNGILRKNGASERDLPTSLPLIQENDRLRITTVISPPFMMLKKMNNSSTLRGNDRFEGFLKDLIDLITQEMGVEYEMNLAEDGKYGRYEESEGKWTGALGEIIQGKADLAAADILISGKRQRVVDFTDPYELVGFSIVMKHPLSIPATSSMFFFVTAFSLEVWIFIIIAILIFGVLFHVITMFTGAPDSIESASGIWGRKHAIIVNAWFATGSSLMQGTGVYPRSISSRILTGVFWFFTLILLALFIASIASQIITSKEQGDDNPKLAQLKEMSLESIISESVTRGWPKVGLVYPSVASIFVKTSRLPIFATFAKYLESNPDLKFKSIEEGFQKVQESFGNCIFFVDSLKSEYAVHRKPCDLINTHDSINFAGYGFATQLGSHWTSKVNDALGAVQHKGYMGHLHQKWWIDTNECKNPMDEKANERTIHVFTGLLLVTAVGFLILFTAFGIQYLRRNKTKENRRQQLSFEDMNLDQTLPTPPPELLVEPTPVLNLPEYDRKTLL